MCGKGGQFHSYDTLRGRMTVFMSPSSLPGVSVKRRTRTTREESSVGTWAGTVETVTRGSCFAAIVVAKQLIPKKENALQSSILQ